MQLTEKRRLPRYKRPWGRTGRFVGRDEDIVLELGIELLQQFRREVVQVRRACAGDSAGYSERRVCLRDGDVGCVCGGGGVSLIEMDCTAGAACSTMQPAS